jgi:hypothetical protein
MRTWIVAAAFAALLFVGSPLKSSAQDVVQYSSDTPVYSYTYVDPAYTYVPVYSYPVYSYAPVYGYPAYGGFSLNFGYFPHRHWGGYYGGWGHRYYGGVGHAYHGGVHHGGWGGHHHR